MKVRTCVAAALLAAAALASAGAAHADDRDHRGRDRHWDRRDHDRRDWGHHDRGRHDWGRRDWDRRHRGPDVSLSFSFGRPYPGYYAPRYYTPPRYYAPPAPAAYNGYGLRPYECRDDRRWDHWRGYPAEIVVQVCANAYGEAYVVQGSQRFVRYR
jgi:hypothetical protein